MAIDYNPVQMNNNEPARLPYDVYPSFTKKEMTGIRTVSKGSKFDLMKLVNPFSIVLSLSLWGFISFLMADRGNGFIFVMAFRVVIFSVMCILAYKRKIGKTLISILVGSMILSILPGDVSYAPVVVIFVLSCIFGPMKSKHHGRGYKGSLNKRTSEVTDFNQTMIPVWGVAGSNVGSNTDFGDMAKIGADGEVIVGRMLKAISDKYPHVRVFHGVKFTPNSQSDADVDHVVLIGNRVLLIDAKNWKFGEYSWGADGKVLRDGEPFVGGDVHMGSAQEKWSYYLWDDIQDDGYVFDYITLASEKTEKYHYDQKYCPVNRSLYLIDLKNLSKWLSHLAEQDAKPFVNRHMVYKIASQIITHD